MALTLEGGRINVNHEGQYHNLQRVYSAYLSRPTTKKHRALHLNWRTRDEPESNTSRLETEAARPDNSSTNAHNIQKEIPFLQQNALSNQSTAATKAISPQKPIGFERQNATGTSSRINKQQERATFTNKTHQGAFQPGQDARAIEKGKQPACQDDHSYHIPMSVLRERRQEPQPLLSLQPPDDQPLRLAQNQPGYRNDSLAAAQNVADTESFYGPNILQKSSVWRHESDLDVSVKTTSVGLPTFALWRHEISSSPVWWTLENLSDTYPSAMFQQRLGNKTPFQMLAEAMIEERRSLNIHHILYLGVVPTTASPGFPATLHRANDLRTCLQTLRFGGPRDWTRMPRWPVGKEYQARIEQVTNIKMIPPPWFEENRFFTDRAAEIRGVGIDFWNDRVGQRVSFCHLDTVLWYSEKAEELFGELDADTCERTPLDEITQLNDVFLDIWNFRAALDGNRQLLCQTQPGATEGQRRFSQLRFKNEILWRCCYINEFMSRVRGSFQAEKKRSFYPFLGPDIELDLWIFENKILRSREVQFDPSRDILTRMYGFGSQELKYLSDRQNTFRDKELAVLGRFHMLQGCLGIKQTEDIAEQLKYCFYAVRNSRDMRDPSRRQKFCDRRREFDIAKVLVDKIWRGLADKPVRDLEMLKREERGIRGEWCTLSPWERWEVLRHDSNLALQYLERP
ncbi:hypothetical protein F4809DRAFT_595641 [Biscogniauxia mediterranea]|nr:hypothetical protein F4809DRAFT_595641 [Biscogniauxia mediterranea]